MQLDACTSPDPTALQQMLLLLLFYQENEVIESCYLLESSTVIANLFFAQTHSQAGF